MGPKNSNLKQKAIASAGWKFAERILAQVISLVVSLIIARLLDPADYGVVSIVTVFFSFANVIISAGLNTALIQKKDADQDDYNTVFTFSFLIAVVVYLILFFAAPWLAQIYRQPTLTQILRVLALSLPIYAVKAIVCAYVSASLQFKLFFVSTLFGTLISAVVGIYMALHGFGPWALVAQQLSNIAIDTVILLFTTKLKLSFKIVLTKLRSLIGYGSRIMTSSLLGVAVNQINPLFIGLKYTSADLSFYTKGRSLPETLSSSMIYTVSSVLFPILAKVQENREKLLKYTRLYMKVVSFIVFPVMFGFCAVAENFVLLCLTEKWAPTVYYIQIACISTAFDVVAAGNCETIKAMGRSDVFLKMEITKKVSYFVTLLLFLMFTNSPAALALSMLVCMVIQVTINSIPTIRLIGYKLRYQLQDLLPNLLMSVAMGAVVMILDMLPINRILLLIMQVAAGVTVYALLAIVTRNSALKYIWDTVCSIRKR